MYPKGYERVNPFLKARFQHLSYPEYYYHPTVLANKYELLITKQIGKK
jgi:hypothetical protein